MSDNVLVLLSLKVGDFSFSVDSFEAKSIQLKAEKSMKCLFSNKEESKAVLVIFEANVVADNEQDFKLSTMMHVEIQADDLPKDDDARDEYVRQKCFPFADKVACEKLNEVLETLGHNKLNLISHDPFN